MHKKFGLGQEYIPMHIFIKLQATGLFLALEGCSTPTNHSASGKKQHGFVNNDILSTIKVGQPEIMDL